MHRINYIPILCIMWAPRKEDQRAVDPKARYRVPTSIFGSVGTSYRALGHTVLQLYLMTSFTDAPTRGINKLDDTKETGSSTSEYSRNVEMQCVQWLNCDLAACKAYIYVSMCKVYNDVHWRNYGMQKAVVRKLCRRLWTLNQILMIG